MRPEALNIDSAQNNKFGICGSTIKIIAMITMLIDHIGAGIIGRYISCVSSPSGMECVNGIIQQMYMNGTLYKLYTALRFIGRMSFPIYCFLIVEGFLHTRSVKRYAVRLLIFAFISEVPFDLLFQGKILEFTYQNVMFTLFIGLLTMNFCNYVRNSVKLSIYAKFLFYILITIAGMGISQILSTDYTATGVLCIMVLYFTRDKKAVQIAAGCVSFAWELPALLAFIPISFYNNKRGAGMKYIYYFFYPVHLLVLYIICIMLGIAGYPI